MWTQQRVNDFWHILTAIKEGKEIEVCVMNKWFSTPSPSLYLHPDDYRIVPPKPEVTQKFVNMYADGAAGISYRTRERADEKAIPYRIGVVITTFHNGTFFKQEYEPCNQ